MSEQMELPPCKLCGSAPEEHKKGLFKCSDVRERLACPLWNSIFSRNDWLKLHGSPSPVRDAAAEYGMAELAWLDGECMSDSWAKYSNHVLATRNTLRAALARKAGEGEESK